LNKDDFLDEKIIQMINQVEKPEVAVEKSSDSKKETPPEERTIYTGIKIGGQWVEFEERTFIEDKIAMMVPKEFKEKSLEMARIKYPSEQRPKTILTDSIGATNISLTHMDTPTADTDMDKIRDGLLVLMRRVNPSIKVQSTGQEIIDDKDVAYAEFTNAAIDGKLYNLMFFFDLEGQPLMGNFNCLTKSMKYWKNPDFEMMRSIKILHPKMK
jgi:hypothetical protein